MGAVAEFEIILLLLVVVVCLELAARWIKLPPAAALILGGGALTFVPGMPVPDMDPDLVLVLFLPPLLAASAYFTAWRDLRRNLLGILNLAVGAVVFTTLLVGVAVHWVLPDLSWGACFALGAVVSPPDAVAAKAVLEHVRLPRRTMVLLEGESLLNDAAGIVLFRFAVAATLTGTFSLTDAVISFTVLGLGGVFVGVIVGLFFTWVLRRLRRVQEVEIGIATTLLMPWTAYISAERVHVSGVIATVVTGLIMGWYQHEIFTANGRRTGTGVWQIMIHLLEAFVFVLIGLSLHGVLQRLGSADDIVAVFGYPVLATVGAVILSRFLWIIGLDCLMTLNGRGQSEDEKRSGLAASIVMSWAGMRGVVTLAIALSLPETMPGRDLILIAAFVVILVTVLLQGTTLGILIRFLRLDVAETPTEDLLSRAQARSRMAAIQLATVEALAHDGDGKVLHPRLLEQYGYRAQAARRFSQEADILMGERSAHFDVVLAAVAAGRTELLRLHRSGQIHDDVLRELEHDLDLQELSAERMRVGA